MTLYKHSFHYLHVVQVDEFWFEEGSQARSGHEMGRRGRGLRRDCRGSNNAMWPQGIPMKYCPQDYSPGTLIDSVEEIVLYKLLQNIHFNVIFLKGVGNKFTTTLLIYVYLPSSLTE